MDPICGSVACSAGRLECAVIEHSRGPGATISIDGSGHGWAEVIDSLLSRSLTPPSC